MQGLVKIDSKAEERFSVAMTGP